MGGFTGGQESQAPQIIPGMEFFPQLLQQFASTLGPQLQGMNFGQLPQVDMGAASGTANAGLQALLSNLGLTGQSQDTFREGLQTGFMPQFTQDIENQLLPALERSFTRGDEAVRGQAADLGAFSSSGTARNTQELRTGLESNLMQQLAGLTGQGALGAQQMRGGLASQGMNLGSQALQGGLGAQQQGLQQFLAPLQALGGLNQGVASTPFFQPTQGPSKFETLLGAGAPIAGAAVGNPSLFGGGK